MPVVVSAMVASVAVLDPLIEPAEKVSAAAVAARAADVVPADASAAIGADAGRLAAIESVVVAEALPWIEPTLIALRALAAVTDTVVGSAVPDGIGTPSRYSPVELLR